MTVKVKQRRHERIWRSDCKETWQPVTNTDLTKGIVYYTDNRCEERISRVCRQNLKNIGLSMVVVSQFPVDFENNIVMPIERSIYSQARQILAGCEALDTDIVFLAEHDVLYHPSHFDFIPAKELTFYYNQNRWPVCTKTGQACFYFARALSHGCAHRKLYIEHYKKRVEAMAVTGYQLYMMHSPGANPRAGFGPKGSRTGQWVSEFPNIDFRHLTNYSRGNAFRAKGKRGFILADEVPYWGKTKGRFDEWIIETAERIYNDN